VKKPLSPAVDDDSPDSAHHDGGQATAPLTDGAAQRVLVRRYTLEVIEGTDKGLRFQGEAERVVVGTHPSAQLVLKDRTLSRFHCEITIETGRAVLKDLGSRNGSIIDGVSVLQAHLDDGAVLTLGQTKLRFILGGDHAQVPLSAGNKFGLLVGRSWRMRALFALLERAAQSDLTVLIQGESGCGKELVADSLHREGPRRDGPFVVVDCASIPRGLIESELFGHEAGAFTGATGTRAGAFETAQGGTLFLDEIGELDLDLQPKLLRALEAREVRRVGGTKAIPVDVRVVAATHRELEREVNARTFRPDLYYRLAVVTARLPALRERAEDLPLLVDELLARLVPGGLAAAPEALRTPEFLSQLARHTWPGNVRELKHHLERCLVMERPVPTTPGQRSGPPPVDVNQSLQTVRERHLHYVERCYLEELVAKHKGNVSAAARAAGVDRVHFYRLLAKAGLR
jgi:DNA-binding NtrC family response regulator